MTDSLKHLGVMSFVWVHFWLVLTILLVGVKLLTMALATGVDSNLLLSMIGVTGLSMAGSLVVTWRVARRFREWVFLPGEEKRKDRILLVCMLLAGASAVKMLLT